MGILYPRGSDLVVGDTKGQVDGNYEFLIHRLDECQSTMTFVSEERMLLFGLVLTLPKLWVAVPCHAAVCFSGHARSFMHPHVREHLKERLLQGLECETDVFFYLALGEAHGSARNAWDNFTRQPMVAPEVVRAAALEFDPIAIVLHRGDADFVSHDCGMDGAPDGVFSQLYKTAACFSLIESAEKARQAAHHLLRHRRYDWIVRVRPDLAWVGPIAPLGSFRGDRIYLPAHFWPIGDMFALVPRHLARDYFHAIDSFYTCRTLCSCDTPWYLANVPYPHARWR